MADTLQDQVEVILDTLHASADPEGGVFWVGNQKYVQFKVEELREAARRIAALSPGWRKADGTERNGKPHDIWIVSSFWTADGKKQPAVSFRVPEAIWFDGQWCDDAGNPHPDLEGWTNYDVTHWMPLPTPPTGETK